jgi:hypothetical protein
MINDAIKYECEEYCYYIPFDCIDVGLLCKAGNNLKTSDRGK